MQENQYLSTREYDQFGIEYYKFFSFQTHPMFTVETNLGVSIRFQVTERLLLTIGIGTGVLFGNYKGQYVLNEDGFLVFVGGFGPVLDWPTESFKFGMTYKF